ncbi:MAG: response regulator, partial [Pontiellaceae bacterium]|nr:response regulator [Pontiellaceae bacterium]
VYRYDGISPAARQTPSLQGANSVDMAVDKSQALWVAKEHFGVCRWRDNAWEVFTEQDGLASVFLSSLLVMDDRSILVSSDKGISRFDGKTWTKNAYPEWFAMSKRTSRMHQSSDGSVWLNYSRGESRELYIAVSENEQYCTVRHRPEKNPPDTRILEYLPSVSQPGNSHITWSGTDLWHHTPAAELQYSWRLNSGEWSAFSHETSKTFLKLDSGRHTLEIRSRDRDFNVDPTPARIEFSVVAPLWRQPWFLLMVSVLVGLIVLLAWLLVRTRERHLKERQAEHDAFLLKQQTDRENHLLEIDRLKTGFFTNISHELRTPLTVIMGPLEMMLNTESDPKKKQVLSMMVRNARRVATLITQLLDFRKIEEGKIGIEATYGDLVPVVNDVVTSLQSLAAKAGISCFLENVEECRGWFDFDKLQKIFTNLIANSIKYTPSGGEVRVRLEAEGPVSEHHLLRFTVEDTGVGIAQEHLEHIFDRFYRVPETSIAVGAGIGLNLTKELVNLLGGEIHVESPISPDKKRPGTRFTVLLPVDGKAMPGDIPDQPVREDLSAVEPSDRSNMSDKSCNSGDGLPLILIVEDDLDIRNFIAEGLSPSFQTETAEDGAEGLRIAKAQVPDLIITDLMMPVMDGIALCRELKTGMETSHIPVIMLTAKTSLEHQMEGLKTGADDYITKPFHMELLRVRIANLLESRRLLREKFSRENAVSTPVIPENTLDKEFFEKTQKVLEEGYSDWEFSPEQFADGLNMSLRTLHRKLKAVAGRTPGDFLNEFRMAKAAELLIGTSLPVTEISFQTGFDEPTNFSRTFKKYYKMSPSKYRSIHQSS